MYTYKVIVGNHRSEAPQRFFGPKNFATFSLITRCVTMIGQRIVYGSELGILTVLRNLSRYTLISIQEISIVFLKQPYYLL